MSTRVAPPASPEAADRPHRASRARPETGEDARSRSDGSPSPRASPLVLLRPLLPLHTPAPGAPLSPQSPRAELPEAALSASFLSSRSSSSGGVVPALMASPDELGAEGTAQVLAMAAELGPEEFYRQMQWEHDLDAEGLARPDSNGLTKLHIVAMFNNGAVTLDLCQRGADLDALDGERATPLMRASSLGNLEAVSALVAAGADINATDAAGSTALGWACGDVETVRAEVVACLLEAPGIAISLAADGEHGPLLQATRFQHEQLLGQLLQHPFFSTELGRQRRREAAAEARSLDLPHFDAILMPTP